MREIEIIRQPRAPLDDPSEVEASYDPVQEEVHLRDYWKTLRKRRGLVILVSLIFVVTGAYFNFTATKVYDATTLLKIEPITPTATTIGELPASTQGLDYYETQFALLKGRALAARVIADLGLDADKRFLNASVTPSNPIERVESWVFGILDSLISSIAEFFTKWNDNVKPDTIEEAEPRTGATEQQTSGSDKAPVNPGLVGKYMSFLQVAPIKFTRLVKIGFVTPDPALSQKLADAHAKGFIRMNLESRFQLTKEAREFLDAKNEELKAKLERSEAELNRFRQAHGVVSIDKGENIVVDRLMEINRQLTTARAQRLEAESLNSVVQDKTTQYLSQVLTQGMVLALRSNLLTLEAEKIKQSTVLKPDHPRMIELNQQINQVKQSLNAEINNVLRGIRENFVAARAKEQALENEAQKQQRAALALKEVGVQFAVLQEEVNVNKNLYDTILRRLNETNISNDIAVSNMQIAQQAERQRRPSAPNIPFNLVIYCVAGVFCGIGLAFFLSYMDSHINSPELVSRVVELNTVGVVPDLSSLNRSLINYHAVFPLRFLPERDSQGQLKRRSKNGKELILSHHPLSVFSEAYRNIRTNLLLSQPEANRKVILITSPSPGEGKTATALNLGIAWAQDGFKVLIIDADMRRGSCHSGLGVSNRVGLSNLLAGEMSLETVIQQTSVEGLSLLPCGACPANPSGLLGTRKMANIITQLRETFDFILLDSPPAMAISDPVVLSGVSDGILLVFHPRKTTAHVARQVKERFDAIRAPVLGVILNGINVADPDYVYYRDYYGSGYGAGAVAAENGNGREHAEPENLIVEDPIVTNPMVHYGKLKLFNELISLGRLEKDSSGETAGSETVPEEFFDRLVSNLTAAVGPMAALLVKDHISLLGESKASFPKNRLAELFDRLCEEILDSTLKNEFQDDMQKKLRLL